MYKAHGRALRLLSVRNIGTTSHGVPRKGFAGQLSKDEDIRTFTESTVLNQPFSAPYFEWVEGDYQDTPSDMHTTCKAESPLITRSNAGMGFLVLNSKYTAISQVNALYRRLADLETNPYKRYVLVTSMSRDMFSYGINPVELLMFKESLKQLSHRADGGGLYRVLQRALDDYLRNICNLSHMIQSYMKPLIVYANGITAGYGTSLVNLANTSACYKHSRMQFNNIELGVPLLGGQSYVLSMLRGSMGEYLALTGREIRGSDLVSTGLVKRYISPDALGVMQLTAEVRKGFIDIIDEQRLVEMPEKETEFQIQEHYMPLDARYSLEKHEWLIHEHFSSSSVSSILKSLEKGIPVKKLRSQSLLSEDNVRKWEMEILDQVLKNVENSSDNADTVLKLIRAARAYKLKVLKSLKVTPKCWAELQQFMQKPAVSAQDHNNRELLHSIQQELLLEALQLEVESFLRTTEHGIKASHGSIWTLSDFCKHPFTPFYRSGFSLSSLPCLRKLHPDYDRRTGSDHDALWMKSHKERWSDDFLQRELMLMKRILC